jgi:hypothetical protein
LYYSGPILSSGAIVRIGSGLAHVGPLDRDSEGRISM